MPLRDVVITPVAVRDPPLLNAFGVHQPWALRSIVELGFDEGVVGLGESYGDERFLALLRDVAPALTGLDVFDLAGLERRVAQSAALPVDPTHGLTGQASVAKSLRSVFSVFEVACLDAQGKLLGRPVVDLLGGRARDRVPFSAYLFYKWGHHPGHPPDAWGAVLDADALVDEARAMIDRFGFSSIKLKGGVMPPAEEIEAILALHAALPGHPLRLDPNTAWTVETSIDVADRLAGALEYLEDPTPGQAGMGTVAARAAMPLATNMCVTTREDIPSAVERAAVGVILADHHYWGGLRASLLLGGICETFGLDLSMHSNSHLGISLAAMVHLAAATPTLRYACDTHRPWQEEDVIVPGPVGFAGGSVAVPDGPGLGVELDRDALARLHEQYRRCGVRVRDDLTYIRTVQPDFEPRIARW